MLAIPIHYRNAGHKCKIPLSREKCQPSYRVLDSVTKVIYLQDQQAALQEFCQLSVLHLH
jgi:hypothetical protein